MKATLDIETNSKHNKIWFVGIHYHDTDQVVICDTVEDLWSAMHGVTEVYTWNGVAFDEPKLKLLWGFEIDKSVKRVDGFLLSRVFNPNRPQGHSLKSYGVELGYEKEDFEDYDGPVDGESREEWWERFRSYCGQDNKVTTKAVNFVLENLRREGFDESKGYIELEHDVRRIITQQEINGFRLDVDYATKLHHVLQERMDEIEVGFQKVFPPITTERYSEKTGKRLKDDVEVFNPGSRQQIAKRLTDLGAKFTKKTDKGSPIVDEKTLAEIDLPEAALLVEYLTLQKRVGQVESWLEAVKEDGRVHGRVQTNGAVTGRMTHNSPNMAQVPAVGKPWGEECRRCWVVDEGCKLVGIDASGLELRMLAHYMKDDDYIKEVVEGDVHTKNQLAAELESRPQAKTFIYAFLYGAGNEKIGQIVGRGSRTGATLKKKFLQATPALKNLIELVQKIAKKTNSVPGLDGRRLRIRSEHAALNTLLQGAGAIVMKKALVIFEDALVKSEIPFKFVCNIHDEWQVDCLETDSERVGQIGVQSIKEAGEALGLRCPLDGEYKIGNSWVETH